MDGREGMTLSGSSSFYFNRGVTASGSASGGGSGVQFGFHAPPGFKPLSDPNISVQSNVRDSSGGSTFQAGNPSPNFPHGGTMAVSSGGSPNSPHGGTMAVASGGSPNFPHGGTMVVASGGSFSDPVKKKRGRPRKYCPDGTSMSLGLSPMSSPPSPGSMSLVPKRSRGRPPGSGRKQQLASLGEWMNSSAGLAFTPHVIHIGVEEDVAAKILSFAQQRPRALCILSANGAISTVSLRQPTSSGGTVTYEGRFEILCLSGSYLLSESGGPRSRTGGLSISVCSPDGHIIGGAIGGTLIAASPVQVVVCSFVYGGNKSKDKAEAVAEVDKNAVAQPSEKSSTPPPPTAAVSQNPTPNPATGGWPLGSQPDLRNPHPEFDLMRG